MEPIGENYVTSMSAGSYWLSRDLHDDERLDWSTCADASGPCDPVGDIKGPCTMFLLRTSPDSNGNALHMNTCYLLEPKAMVKSSLEKRSLVRHVHILMLSAF